MKLGIASEQAMVVAHEQSHAVHMNGAAPVARLTVRTPVDYQPTLEEQLLTIFIGRIPKELNDVWMEKLLEVGRSYAND